ncbi:hypothetical protein BKA64DRAFT_682082 [Cadophora sp. MPI-SDFR-AT-0126]|nr:hypothetical protein BKA64DRAFT_682082 [Leotiomycetes sp. MPI-SDFR-AT-0126]
MRFLLASILALQCISLCYSMSYDVSDQDEEQALQDLLNAQKQAPVFSKSLEATEVDHTNAKNFFGLTNGLYDLVDTLGSIINRVSGRGKCQKSYGSVNGVSWVYYAIGPNCETAPEARFIKGAVKHHLDSHDCKKTCGMECLDLSQSRGWSGYLLIGPTSDFDYKMYCGPTLPLNTYSSGGRELKDEL